MSRPTWSRHRRFAQSQADNPADQRADDVAGAVPAPDPVRYRGGGRTYSGVWAAGQVAGNPVFAGKRNAPTPRDVSIFYACGNGF
jgi:hypothetical protein